MHEILLIPMRGTDTEGANGLPGTLRICETDKGGLVFVITPEGSERMEAKLAPEFSSLVAQAFAELGYKPLTIVSPT